MNKLLTVGVLFVASVSWADAVFLEKVGPNKIQVIKVAKECTGLGLKQAAALVEGPMPVKVADGLSTAEAEALVSKFLAAGASAGARTNGGSPRKIDEQQDQKTEAAGWSVRLESPGPNKLQVIAIVRDATSLGMTESKRLVDSAPVIVKKGLTEEGATTLGRQLFAAGGKATTVHGN